MQDEMPSSARIHCGASRARSCFQPDETTSRSIRMGCLATALVPSFGWTRTRPLVWFALMRGRTTCAGVPDGRYADGISLQCANSDVLYNLIEDATDGGI